MIIIADSGSTKTDWCVLESNKVYQSVKTIGINPYYQSDKDILKGLQQDFRISFKDVEQIYFYGAGCANAEKTELVKKALSQFFNTNNITVNSDLLGAAKSLCQDDEGIACIMGTGSNSCHYKAGRIIKNVAPLGYRLGDEGSGAVIGEKLVSDILKKQLSASTIKMFFDKYQVTADEIINNVYTKNFPNRYLAKFTKFISENLHIKELENIVLSCFDNFIQRNLMQYDKIIQLKVHFTGSIAFHFKNQLEKNMNKYGLSIGKITKSPMEGLILYHNKYLGDER